jgi:hypothetical protein
MPCVTPFCLRIGIVMAIAVGLLGAPTAVSAAENFRQSIEKTEQSRALPDPMRATADDRDSIAQPSTRAPHKAAELAAPASDAASLSGGIRLIRYGRQSRVHGVR